jgi:hypothetical protein
MKKRLLLLLTAFLAIINLKAQRIKINDVPAAVKSSFTERYPKAAKVTWEKEKGNYEANWGGKSGEDNSAKFTPSGTFVEIVKAIAITDLPANVPPYVKKHFNGAKILEAGKATDAFGKISYEVEIKGSDLIFDENGIYLKKD